jgi:hypothetical protein
MYLPTTTTVETPNTTPTLPCTMSTHLSTTLTSQENVSLQARQAFAPPSSSTETEPWGRKPDEPVTDFVVSLAIPLTLSTLSSPTSTFSPSEHPTSAYIPKSRSNSPSSTIESVETALSPIPSPLATTDRPILAAPLIPTSSSTANDGKYIGIIVGVIVGSVVGAIVLGVFVYWFHAWCRGINVCKCIGSFGKKKDSKQESLPTRRTEAYPMSEDRATPRTDNIARSLRLPRRVAENHQAGRLLRHGPSEKRSKSLDTIDEV